MPSLAIISVKGPDCVFRAAVLLAHVRALTLYAIFRAGVFAAETIDVTYEIREGDFTCQGVGKFRPRSIKLQV